MHISRTNDHSESFNSFFLRCCALITQGQSGTLQHTLAFPCLISIFKTNPFDRGFVLSGLEFLWFVSSEAVLYKFAVTVTINISALDSSRIKTFIIIYLVPWVKTPQEGIGSLKFLPSNQVNTCKISYNEIQVNLDLKSTATHSTTTEKLW